MQSFKYLFFCSIVILPQTLFAVSSVFIPRTQGYYQMHYLRPYDDYRERCEQPAVLGSTLAYFQSEKPQAIARALFGKSTLTFSGSEVADRNPSDLRADDFGLAPDFVGTISFAPRMKTIAIDFFYHLNLTAWCETLFIEMGAPLVHTCWDLRACQSIQQRGSLTFPLCEMSMSTAGVTEKTTSSIEKALSGNFLFGDMQDPWRNAAFNFNTQDRTRLADVSFAMGVDFYQSDPCTLTAAILTIMPTGNNYNPKTVFSPMIGSSDHWELGGYLRWNGHYEWDETRSIDGYIMGTFTHLFDNQQRRTFDFRGKGPLSRYLLLKQLDVTFPGGVPQFNYNGNLINAVNFTTRQVEVACAIQGDLVFQASYRSTHFTLDAGYTLYGRTHEEVKIICVDIPCNLQGHFYAIKGTTGTCYRLYDTEGGSTIQTEVEPDPENEFNLNTSQQATIFTTGRVDSPVPIPVTGTQVPLTWNSNNNNANIIGQTLDAVTGAADFQAAASSQPPLILTRNDLDPASAAAPSCRIHTFYLQMGYHWDCACMEPTLLVGAGQMAGRYGKENALCQWGSWIQFNARF